MNGLWRDGVFRRFWLAHAITVTGSWITFVALPLLVYQRTGSAFQTALLTALELLPYLTFGLLAGAVADRVDRRRLMIGAELANAAVLASVPVAEAAGVLTLAHVYAVALLSMSIFVWFDAANFGALPALVGSERIVDAQSAIWSTTMFLGVVGPALGGALAAGLGAANAIALDAVSFAACALVLVTIRRPFQLHEALAATTDSVVRRTMHEIGAGLSFLWSHALVRTLTLLGLGVSFTGGAVTGLLIVFATQALGVSARGGAIGVLFSAGALGALLAALAVPRVQRRFGATRVTLAVLSIDTVLIVALALSPGYVPALGLYFAWSAAQMLVIVNGIALRQTVTPDHLQSRVNVSARMIALAGTPFGALVGGLLAEAFSVRAALLVGGRARSSPGSHPFADDRRTVRGHVANTTRFPRADRTGQAQFRGGARVERKRHAERRCSIRASGLGQVRRGLNRTPQRCEYIVDAIVSHEQVAEMSKCSGRVATGMPLPGRVCQNAMRRGARTVSVHPRFDMPN